MTEISPYLNKDLMQVYRTMVQEIEQALPSIDESNESFYKSDSQTKITTLDITDLTPIGTAKHILARIEKKREALQNADITLRRKRIEIEQKLQEMETASDLQQELLALDVEQLQHEIETSRHYASGAIRETRFLVEQYEAICQILGVDVITEEMYEEDQPRYHVMRAFSQALAAARSRGGVIDEGNFIYLQDLGINGAAAQREIVAFLEAEQEVLNSQRVPTFEMQYKWLVGIGEKFAPQVRLYAEYRGMRPFVPAALAQRELAGS